MRLLDASNTSYICVSPTGVFRCSDKKILYCSYLPRIVDDQYLIPIASRPRYMLHQYPNVGGLNLPLPPGPTPMCNIHKNVHTGF